MTKLNKNRKIVMLVAVALVAIVAINAFIWHGANATQNTDSQGTDITRNGVKVVDASYRTGCYYRFSEKDGNMGPWVLNVENASVKWPDDDEPIMWWNPWNHNIGNGRPALLYDDPDLIPSCSDDFVYHHNGEHYEMFNMHFGIPSMTYHGINFKKSPNTITLEYHTATPGGSEENNFEFHFDVDLMPDGKNVEKTIHMWDCITDSVDNTGHADADMFDNLGNDNGDSMETALKYVGAENIFQAVMDHKMVIWVVELRFYP